MKQTFSKTLIIAFTVIVALVAFVSTGLACWNHRMGHGLNATPHVTADQQQKLDAVREKYSARLDKLQSALNSKAEEYSEASANDETTVGALNRLDAERAELERQYRALLDQANSEAGAYAPGHDGPWFACNYSGCNHQRHRGNHSYGRHMGPSHQHGMHRRHMARCW